jgi:CheY-like chemotaxis protein
VAVHRDEMTAQIVQAYCTAAGADVIVVADLAAAREHLRRLERPAGSDSEHALPSRQRRLSMSSGPTVVLLGIAVATSTHELDLPADVGIVRLVRRGHNPSLNEIAVLARPLLYQDLLHGVAVASGRLTATNSTDKSERRRPPPRTQAPTVDQALRAGRLILLAEDNETNREVIREQLRLLGYAAEMAEDGAVALKMWQSRRYALLLTDCHMPNMDGFELTEAIRQAEAEGAHLPIIAVTANAMQGEAQRCLEHGMDDYLSKPLRLNELGPMLAKWLPPPAEMTAEVKVAGEVMAKVVASNPPKNADESRDENAAQATSVESVIWDPATLTRMVGDNPAMHRRLLATFLLGAKDGVAAIGGAVTKGELGIIAAQAHSLKSSSRTVGALALGDLLEEMETAGRSGDLDTCRLLAASLDQAFAAASNAIGQQLG